MTPAGLERLKRDEWLVLVGYPDPESPLGRACARAGIAMWRFREIANWQQLSGAPWAYGYGQTGAGVGPDSTCTLAEAEAMLATRVAAIEAALGRALPWFAGLNPVWADVLVNIAYNVGVMALEHWPNTLACFQRGDAQGAAFALRHEGRWNRQVGRRAVRLARAVERGTWEGVESAPPQTVSPAPVSRPVTADPPAPVPVAPADPAPAPAPAPALAALQPPAAPPVLVDPTPAPAQLRRLLTDAVLVLGALAAHAGLTLPPSLLAQLLTMAGPAAVVAAAYLGQHHLNKLSRALIALAAIVPDSIAQVKPPAGRPAAAAEAQTGVE